MIVKLAALTMLPMLLVGGVVMNSSVMVVSVHEAGGTNITVPVPLALAQVVMAFAPDEIKYVDIEHADDEVARYWPYLERIVDELGNIPDAVLVEVEDGNDHVIVAKDGDVLRVSVDEGNGSGETVRVNVPLSMVSAMLDAYDKETGTLRTSRLVGALRAAPSGELVHVLDGRDEVSIRMW
jgi:hypothetical protein